MASRKEYEMLFQLDAKLGSSYTSTFSKAKSGPSELQKEIRSLQSVQADISAYTKQQAAVEKTQAKLDNLNKQYQLLQQEIKETNGPTTSLERESAKLEQRIGDTSNALATQKERLSQTAASLSAAGISTERLGEANADLSDRLSYLRTKQIAATKSAEEFGSVGVSSIESVAQAYASTKIYDALGKIKDAYIAAGEASIEYESDVAGVYKTVDGTDAQLASIYVLMEDGTIAGQEVKNAVLAACNADETRPLTDHVLVEDPETVEYDIDATYYLNRGGPSAADVQSEVNAAVDAYVKWQAGKLGRDINPSELTRRMMVIGVKRVVIRSPVYTELRSGNVATDASGRVALADLTDTVPQVGKLRGRTVTSGGYEDE